MTERDEALGDLVCDLREMVTEGSPYNTYEVHELSFDQMAGRIRAYARAEVARELRKAKTLVARQAPRISDDHTHDEQIAVECYADACNVIEARAQSERQSPAVGRGRQ